ncbi:MAG TPA: T9SS type A sorting domain-containing protein [Bacteroidota bacterium]|nr:T9SS type A sorting domain-containing protein [Bacteroidota bacterium]
MKPFYLFFSAFFLLSPLFAQTPLPMSSTAGMMYTENFSDIADWTNGFASGTGAERFGAVDTNSRGTIPDGIRITVPTQKFSTGTSAGVQRGTGNILLLATGTADNSASAAIDLFVDFTGVAPGMLSFRWGDSTNGTVGASPRCASLRVYTSGDGAAFTELTAAAVLNLVNGALSFGTLSGIPLPQNLKNCSAARIRFYCYNGTGGTTGSRPKISIDDITITAGPESEPKSQPTALVFSNVGSTSMQVSFTPSATAESYLVLRRTSALPTGIPADGNSYIAGQTIGDGVVEYAGSGTSFTEEGLTASTTYGYEVFAFNGKGYGTNYLTAAPLTGSKTTGATAAASLSDIVAIAGSETAAISSISNHPSPLTSTTGTQVWQVKIRDGGAALSDGDGKPTIVTGLTFTQGPANKVADWSSAILAADLFDGSTHLASGTIGAASLVFGNFTATAPSKGTKTLSLRISLKTSGLHDGQVFQFKLTPANTITQNDVTSSQMSLFPAAVSDSAKNAIGVIATQLVFIAAPVQFANLNTNISVSLEARDANNNKDTEAHGNVTILLASGTDAPGSASGLTKVLSSGSVSWDDIRFTKGELGVSLTASNTGGLINPTSGVFETTNAIVVENFPYAVSGPITGDGWSAHGAEGTNPICVVSPGLTYAGYHSSGIGNAAQLSSSGEDDHVTFFTIASGSVYASMLVNVSAAQSGGDFFFHFSTSSLGTFTGRVFVKDSAGKLAFGVSKSSTEPNYTRAVYSYNTTYLLVLKYTFKNKSDTDDTADLFVDPPLNAPEHTPSASAPAGENDAQSIGAIALRQGGAGTAPTLRIDGIRVATSWGNVPLPVELSSFTARTAEDGVELRWTTATETENYGFEVERSTMNNEQSTMNGWVKLGFVAGQGTSSSIHRYSFKDVSAVVGSYNYRLKQIDRNGNFEYSDEVEATITLAPNTMLLGQNYPNPFNPETSIEFAVPTAGIATLKVYNTLGEEVMSLFDGDADANLRYRVRMNAGCLSSGIYFYVLQSGGKRDVKKMLLLK